MVTRVPLTRERIIDAAARVADAGGLAAVSMRNVGAELGAQAMSLYHHVSSKEALLDGLADWVFAEITLPKIGTPWREAMVERATSARRALAQHPWALTLIESRANPGPRLLRHHDTVLGLLRAGGFSARLASHAFSVIDAYVYGFVVTELHLPFDADSSAEEFADSMHVPADEYPHLAEMLEELVKGKDYVFADEFTFGLDIILDELARRLDDERGASSRR